MPAADSPQSIALEPIPENLFREPIEYLLADHYRQRVMGKIIDELIQSTENGSAAVLAEFALNYLDNEFPLHISDEKLSLFPLLRRRCRPEDNIAGIIGLLSEEHDADEELMLPLVNGLRRLAVGERLPDREAFVRLAARCNEGMRRHLAWENGVLLPLARKRLSCADMAELGRSMAARRSAAYPDEG